MNLSDLKPSPAVRALNPELFNCKGKLTSSKQPNKNEQRFYDEYLNPLMRRGVLNRVIYEARSFKLYSIKYTPDWVCTRPDGGIVCYECKPFYKNQNKVHWHPGSKERLKMAASLYPNIEWYATWKQDGIWQEERIMGKGIDKSDE